MEETFLFKDVYNKDSLTYLATMLKETYPCFDAKKLIAIHKDFPPLGFKQRAFLIAESLHPLLPQDFEKTAAIIVKSLPEEKEELGGNEGFIFLPLCHYIGKYGIDYFETSMEALKELTKQFSSEFDVRFFIQKYPKKSLALLRTWTKDKSHHVRRLVSEGTRTRLPWAFHLKEYIENPQPVIALLELLKEDPSLYVRRSVANSINDIAKDHPDIAVQVLQKWHNTKNEGTKWIVRHAARTLLKEGNKEVLSLLGYEKPEIIIQDLQVTPSIKRGEEITFTFTLTSKQKQQLMIDYAIHFMKSNGKQAPKVFKLAKKKAGKETFEVQKSHSFKQITTRVYYPGEHQVEIIINGISYGKKTFRVR